MNVTIRPETGRRHTVGGWRMWLALATLLSLAPLTLLAGCAAPNVPFTGGAGLKTITVPATVQRGSDGATLIIVNVTINGQGAYPFALDTGASLTLLDLPVARALQLPVSGPQRDVTGVGGTERVTPVSVTHWSLGAAALPAATITTAPMTGIHHSAGIVGLLGSDVLSSFASVTIDYTSGLVILTP